MEIREYSKMAEVEEQMWWYRALHRNLLDVILKFLKKRSATVLDAGCGTGGFMRFFANNIPSFTILGLDIWMPACETALLRSNKPVIRGDVNSLPVADNSIDCLISADVLYHEGVVLETALQEIYRCLRFGGFIVTNLPAYEWLRSYHDARVKTHKRFRRSEVQRLLTCKGFKILYNTYWNTLPFPLMVLRRKIFKPISEDSDVRHYSGLVERFFRFLMSLEFTVLHRGGTFPFGGSILTIATKRNGQNIRS
jgi:ubiquinone/menaquinone biosynthesis C-methylase UbiE